MNHKLIAARRKAKGYTLKALGEKIGVKYGQIWMIENGRCQTSVARIALLAQALDVSVEQLLSSCNTN